MTSQEIRSRFLEFFKNKEHQIVASAPMVVKDDPTLMFTNAGMNQFKEIFLGHKKAQYPRVADTQKCLRVSGKHNDLEEVGHDTYHHTMFEMLGNWSFGDYFKEEAIAWAWELLTKEFGIAQDRLYVTVFGGDDSEKLAKDEEAFDCWKKWIPQERILDGSKKDNFWEMGDMGPCGPCSEIHIDIRSDEERAQRDGKTLVNRDHPLVIEIWNLVFIQYNRKADGSLEALPARHIDTGMGFERLAMVLQGVQSNYDTDVFQPLIQKIASMAGKKYGDKEESDIAMRVVADHLRAVAFAIADGQMPSNNKAGYVIRRILRRAIRYGYTFLGFDSPFIHRLVPLLAEQMGSVFAELERNKQLIEQVIKEEEASFLRTLATGLNLLQKIMDKLKSSGYSVVKGSEAFELYDTYGFPFDLTELILRENQLTVSKREFDEEMERQKARSRADAAVESSDMIVLREDDVEEFVGYDHLQTTVEITKYRTVKVKNKTQVHLVFNITPFYPESGGQVGDTGYIESPEGDHIAILDTFKENNLIIHKAERLPSKPDTTFKAVVDSARRRRTANNHSATHLLHYALRQVLGDHVEQKGSLVTDEYLRFDFSHFKKMEEQELRSVEQLVNRMIRNNLQQQLFKDIPMSEARELGAVALFGEKYGDVVRVVRFGDSIELCGGTHVEATGQIGLFVIRQETSIAAGIRRIEALTAEKAEEYCYAKQDALAAIQGLLKNQKDPVKGVQNMLEQNKSLQKELDSLGQKMVQGLKAGLMEQVEDIHGVHFLAKKVDLSSEQTKNLIFDLARSINRAFIVLATVQNDKPLLMVSVSKELSSDKGIHAGNIIRELAREIKGGGGGQPHFASAGGKDSKGIDKALSLAKSFIPE